MINEDLLQREGQELAVARQSLPETTTQLNQARQAYKSADENEQARALGPAINQYEIALRLVTDISERLRPHVEVQEVATIAPLRKAREEACDLAQKATDLATKSRERLSVCQGLRKSARAKLDEAQQNLDARQFIEAKGLAGKARQIDTDLNQEVSSFLNKVVQIESEEIPNRAPMIIVAVVFIVVIVLLLIFGPTIWFQIQRFFFPPTSGTLPSLFIYL